MKGKEKRSRISATLFLNGIKINGEDIGYDPVFDNILGFTVDLNSDVNPATGAEGFARIGMIAAISLLGVFAFKKRCK